MAEIENGGHRYRHYLRKLVHMLFGIPALAVKFIPHPYPVVALGVLAVVSWTLRPYWPVFQTMARATELRDGVMWGVRYYFGTLFIVALLWGDRPEILTAVWLVLALGDGLSAIVGGPASIPVPWNPAKRLYGSVACFVGAAAALLIAVVWFGIPVNGVIMYKAGTIGLAVAVVESLRTPLDDNLLIGFATAILCTATAFFV